MKYYIIDVPVHLVYLVHDLASFGQLVLLLVVDHPPVLLVYREDDYNKC